MHETSHTNNTSHPSICVQVGPSKVHTDHYHDYLTYQKTQSSINASKPESLILINHVTINFSTSRKKSLFLFSDNIKFTV